ncbi:MAG: DNA polymerase III subunit gamma/tau [Actinobacteria bacterium]|nr:DNA polymerase III subunit gamma/tau [Actinomycetota bacterium]
MCQAITDGRGLDVVEIDAASNRGIDEIRDLRERVNFAPNSARFKVYIIDEVHMLTEPAFNALLKTLEEPPGHAIFILATTEAHKVPATIMSRCQRFDFRRIPQSSLIGRLEHVCREEGITMEPAALGLVARATTGSLRDALNMLEQLVTFYGTAVTAVQVTALLGITGDERVRELAGHIFNRDVASGLTTINGVSDDGLDMRQFGRELVEHLRNLMLIKAGAEGMMDVPAEALARMKETVTTVSMEAIVRAIKLFGQMEMRAEERATLPLELALVDCVLADSADSNVRSSEQQPVRERPVKEREGGFSAKQSAPPKAAKPVPESSESTVEKPVVETPPVEKPAEVGGDLSSLWKRVVEAGRPKGIDALLRSCTVLSKEDMTVSVRCNKFVKGQIEAAQTMAIVEEVVKEILGAPHKVRCEEERAEKAAKPKAGGHLVRLAVEEMGAKIVSEE